jgi:hypothetical protein
MRRAIPIVFMTAILVLAGCQGHEAKVNDLQKKYDRLALQFHQDCDAEYQKLPPNVSQKCKDEDKKLGDASDQLMAERGKR